MRVVDGIPPPDVDNATTERIVDSLSYTARVADEALQNVHPRRTLANALAKLDEVETYVIATTDWIVSSMARLTLSNNAMSGRLDEQDLLSRRLASNIEEHTVHITNLMEFEKARRQQMDDHWKRLEEIEEMVKRTDATIHTTNDAIAETACQNKRLTAQLKGIRANAETAATVATMSCQLSKYTCIGRVVACSFQQKYDFSQILLRPADVLPTPAPLVILVLGVLSGAYSHWSS